MEALLVEAMEECGRVLTGCGEGGGGGEDVRVVVRWLEQLLGYMMVNCLCVQRSSALRLRDALPRAALVSMSSNGVCPLTGARLRRLDLTPEERATVRAALLDLAGGQGEEHRSKLERCLVSPRAPRGCVVWCVRKREGVCVCVSCCVSASRTPCPRQVADPRHVHVKSLIALAALHTLVQALAAESQRA